MSNQALSQLVRKYYGYVADMEGSGMELFDLLFVRDKIEAILAGSTPETEMATTLYEQIYALDRLLWAEREALLTVVGVSELRHARQQQHSLRSHWWWYLDDLLSAPSLLEEQHYLLSQVVMTA